MNIKREHLKRKVKEAYLRLSESKRQTFMDRLSSVMAAVNLQEHSEEMGDTGVPAHNLDNPAIWEKPKESLATKYKGQTSARTDGERPPVKSWDLDKNKIDEDGEDYDADFHADWGPAWGGIKTYNLKKDFPQHNLVKGSTVTQQTLDKFKLKYPNANVRIQPKGDVQETFDEQEKARLQKNAAIDEAKWKSPYVGPSAYGEKRFIRQDPDNPNRLTLSFVPANSPDEPETVSAAAQRNTRGGDIKHIPKKPKYPTTATAQTHPIPVLHSAPEVEVPDAPIDKAPKPEAPSVKVDEDNNTFTIQASGHQPSEPQYDIKVNGQTVQTGNNDEPEETIPGLESLPKAKTSHTATSGAEHEIAEETGTGDVAGFSPANWVSKRSYGSPRGVEGSRKLGYTPVNLKRNESEETPPHDWKRRHRVDPRNAYGQTRDKLGTDGRKLEDLKEAISIYHGLSDGEKRELFEKIRQKKLTHDVRKTIAELKRKRLAKENSFDPAPGGSAGSVSVTGANWATPNYSQQSPSKFGDSESPNTEHETNSVTGSMWNQPAPGEEEPHIPIDENGGIPKLGGATAVGHYGQPIALGKIVTNLNDSILSRPHR